ncbi:MAG: DMT family transporter [Chloroflexi bacterium]|nr:DMT family transporter [Chloroflexota bacterium]
MMNRKAQVAIVVMFLTAVWFGLQPWITQSAVQLSSAAAFNTQRYVIAAALMGIVCLATRAKVTRRALISGGAVGLAYAVTIGFEMEALAAGSVGRVTFIGSLFVAFMPFLGFLLHRRKIQRASILGGVLMVAGVWWLFYTPNALTGGDLYALLRAAAAAGLLLAIEKFAGADWRVSSFVNFCVVALCSFAAALFSGQTQFSMQSDVLLPALIAALFGSVLCMVGMQWSGRWITATLMGVMLFMDSPMAVVWGMVMGKESLTPTSMLAYTLIAVGAIAALTAGSLRLPRLFPRRADQPVITAERATAV